MKIFKICLMVLLFVVFGFQKGFCSQGLEGLKEKGLREIGFFSGRGKANLKDKADYELIPAGVRLAFDMKPFIKDIKFKDKYLDIKGSLDLLFEPYLAAITSPDPNFECGTGFLLRYGYKIDNFFPFVETGTGFQWTSQHTREEGTQFCFQLQGGCGFYYFFAENQAVNFGYRFRHFSNRNIKQPNTGIDVHMLLIGVSTFF
ncbi:MAG: acyloxyacyl hydrolase [Candidatus Omnitrophica bacterium]|nr:acyloxyacyl hydrolase [Candidatus Omnitrophota bacterium]